MATDKNLYPVLHQWISVSGNFLACVLVCLLMGPAFSAGAQDQLGFDSPEAGMTALLGALKLNDTSQLEAILGPLGPKLVNSGDAVADQHGRQAFLKAYNERHALVRVNETHIILILGQDEWPMPIPLVDFGDQWRFDTEEGAQEILMRRIGRNELAAIQVCRAIVDAQYEYAALNLNNNGLLEYAQKFVSTPGIHDGLFWETKPGEPLSPLGPLLVAATHEGYSDSYVRPFAPYHGYFYKLLGNQGPDASGGAYAYVVNGHMIGGFAVMAYPATYGVSGVMSFIVNYDGVVYQKDLGAATENVATHMTTYNPDTGWTSVSSAPDFTL